VIGAQANEALILAVKVSLAPSSRHPPLDALAGTDAE